MKEVINKMMGDAVEEIINCFSMILEHDPKNNTLSRSIRMEYLKKLFDNMVPLLAMQHRFTKKEIDELWNLLTGDVILEFSVINKIKEYGGIDEK